MSKLNLSTKKSLHPPIEVDIDGKTYRNRPLSKTLFDEIRKYEKAALKGDQAALYKQVQLLFGVPFAVLNELDIRDINSLLEYTMAQIFKEKPETDEEKAEKNVLKPGEEASAK